MIQNSNAVISGRTFPLSLLPPNFARLQIKLPDHPCTISYKVSEVYEAALYDLRLASATAYLKQYSLGDMDALIGERLRLGIGSVNDLADFHMRFLATTNWFIKRGPLSDLEQQRNYIRAFPPSLLPLILARLQVKLPDHHLHIPYKDLMSTKQHISSWVRISISLSVFCPNHHGPRNLSHLHPL